MAFGDYNISVEINELFDPPKTGEDIICHTIESLGRSNNSLVSTDMILVAGKPSKNS